MAAAASLSVAALGGAALAALAKASGDDTFTANAQCILSAGDAARPGAGGEGGAVWLGSEDAAHAPLHMLKAHGITHIVTCGFGISMPHAGSGSGVTYHAIKAVDLPVFNLLQFIPDAVAFVQAAIAAAAAPGAGADAKAATSSGGAVGVLIHCARGKSRSAAVCIAYVMHSNRWSYAQAHAHVRKYRPEISLNSSFEAQLRVYERLGWALPLDSPWRSAKTNVNELLAAEAALVKQMAADKKKALRNPGAAPAAAAAAASS